MYRLDRNTRPANGLRRRTALAAAMAALALSAGCGEDPAEQVEAPANEPDAQAEVSAPPQASTAPAAEPCELPPKLVADKPWVANIPC